MSILIKSAKIIDANSKFNGKTLDILIINGKIKEIAKNIPNSKAKDIITKKHSYVFLYNKYFSKCVLYFPKKTHNDLGNL